MASTSGVDLSISGLASGFDWKTVVSQLAQAERAPESVWLKNQAAINRKNSAFTIIKSYLSQLQTSVAKLKDASLYDARSAQSTTATVATAAASAGGLTGSFNFNISHLATAATFNGTGSVAKVISPDGDLSSITVGAAGFATSATAGTVTVNGAQVAIATTDSLQSVFAKIATATSNAVTASYDKVADKITLTSANPANEIVLGSAADTSNFLQVAKLYNNGSGSVVSNDTLGRVNLQETLANADLQTAVTDGGSGAGEFKVNGVSINFNSTTDTMQNVVDRINGSAAGVSAAYDISNNKFVLTNKSTGDTGIALSDVTGNFLAATGLSGGSLSHGQNLVYSINSGPTLVSQSNTIDSSSSGISGLSVTALTAGATTISVGSDTSAIKTNLQTFITAYNNVQSYLTANTATSTDANGKLVAGTLTGDVDAGNLATSLRSATLSPVSITGLSATLSQLAGLGIKSNGQDNTITLSDSAALDSALAGNLSNVKNLFADSTRGLAVQLDKFLTNAVGDSGTLTAHQTALTKRSTDIDKQIANLEKSITADAAFWTKEFQAMETAQAKSNQVLSSLTQQINKGTL